jgi:mannose-6-phosphate isomerase-like protein (cupin superfamily)
MGQNGQEGAVLGFISRKTDREFYTRERCHITEILNDPASPEMSIARCRVEPGVVTELHSLTGVAETYLVESGCGDMDDGEGPARRVGPGDLVLIPAGHAQRITNCGPGDLVFLAVCRPGFVPACYTPLE